MKSNHEYRWCVAVVPDGGYLKKLQPLIAREGRETANLVFFKSERFRTEQRYGKRNVRVFWCKDKFEAMQLADKINRHLNIKELVRLREEQEQRERDVLDQVQDIIANGIDHVAG